nr:zincin-like metallopeptidase domain-containing protein [Novosphingobium sp. Gsoil 351]
MANSARFGSADYAMEELIAELGAAFTCVILGLVTEPRLDHGPYVGSWLKVLRGESDIHHRCQDRVAADYLAKAGA